MSLNLKSSLAPLDVGPAPSGPSLSSVNIPISQGYQGSGLTTVGSMIAPGIGTAVGAIGDSLLGYFSQRSANKANAKLAEYQNKWNLEQWKRENDYNLPINQLRRFQDAGINPMLAMGNMDSGNAPALESAPMANQQAFTNFNGFQNLNQNLLAKEANDISRYNAETNRMDVKSNLPIKKQQLLNMQQEEQNLKKTANQIDATTHHIHQLLSNARKEGLKLSKEIDYQDLLNGFEREFGSKTRQAQLDNLLADTKHKNALIREINNNMYLAKKNLEIAIKGLNFNIKNGQKLTEIQRVTCNNNAKLMKQSIRQMVRQGKLTEAEGKKKELEVDNYWNERGQDFLQQTFNFLMMGLLLRGKNLFGNIGKGSYKPPTMDGKPPVPYN